MLILPDEATVTSGNNPALIGNLNGGASTEVTWIVVFEKKGTHTLEVCASGYDSNGNPCSASKSTTIVVKSNVKPEPESEVSPPIVPLELMIVVGIFSIVAVAGALVLWKRRRSIN